MRTLLFGITLAACTVTMTGSAQAPLWCWATGLGGNGSAGTEYIAASATNGSFITGAFGSTMVLPSGTLVNDGVLGNQFIAGVDSLGNVLWAVQHSQPVAALSATAGGGVVCVIPYFGNQVFDGVVHNGSASAVSALVIELDASGTVVAETNVTDLVEPMISGSQLRLAVDADAGLAVLAQYTDSVMIMGQWLYTTGTALARLSLQGDLLWAQRIGNASPDNGALHLQGDGRVLALLSQAEPVLPNDTVFTDWSGTMASYSAQGAYEWRVHELGYDVFDPPVIDRKADGGAFVGISQPSQGPIGGGTALILKSISSLGVEEWTSSSYGSSQWGHRISSIVDLPADRALIAGYALSPLPMGQLSLSVPNGPNGFVGIVNNTGGWEWVASETSGDIMGFRAVHGTTNRVYVTGRAITSATFGSTMVPMVGGNNFNGVVGCLGDFTLDVDEQSGSTYGIVWPNPAHDHLVLQTQAGATVRITDTQGRIVIQTRIGAEISRVDIGTLKPGLYTLLLGGRGMSFVKE